MRKSINLTRNKRRNRRGVALIGVLWIVLFLGLLAASVRSLAHLESELARSTVERAQAEALADAGVFWTVHQLCDRELV